MSSKGLCKLLFVVLFLLLTCAYGDSNLLRNGGFESGTDGWTDRSCPIEAVKSPVHSGSGSARAYGRSDTWQGIKQSLAGKMMDGETYQVSGWVRLENSTSDTVTVSFEQQDDGGVNYHNVASAAATDSNWVRLSGEFTLVVDGELSVLDVYFEGPAVGVNFFVDDANVYGPGAGPDEGSAAEAAAIKPEATGEIDVNTRYQEIEGIGASGAHYTMEFIRHKQKSELYNLLFKESVLDIFRIKNNHGMEPNSFSETVEIVKGAEAAVGRDLKIMMSSWSPPAYLKSNESTIGGTLKKSDGKYMYTEFAQWWYDSLAAYEKTGVKVDYISIQNEPDYQAGWDSCQMEPTETSSSAGYDTAFEAVRQKLNKEMGSSMPKMLAPETSGLDRIGEYIDNLDDLSYVYGYAHHLYNCSGDGDTIPGCGAAPDRYLSAMKRFKSKYGTKPLFQTEYEHRPGEWDDAMNTAVLMHNALTAEGVSGYLYWDLFWGSMSGLASIDDPRSITIKPTYYTFKQYSAFVDSGWQRVEASSDSPGLRISAYISPDKQKLTAVVINTTDGTDITLDLSFKGFSVSKGEVYRSSRGEKCARIGSYDRSGPLTLPANSVTTLVLRASVAK